MGKRDRREKEEVENGKQFLAVWFIESMIVGKGISQRWLKAVVAMVVVVTTVQRFCEKAGRANWRGGVGLSLQRGAREGKRGREKKRRA